MNRYFKLTTFVLLGSLSMVASVSAFDVNRSVFWNTSGTGSYGTITNWSYLVSTTPTVVIGNRLPATNDQVFIQTGGTVNIDGTVNTPSFDWLEVGGNLGTYSPYVPTGPGYISQTGGSVNVKWLGIGYDAGTSGMSTYTMSGGQINKTIMDYTTWEIGYKSKGKLAMSGTAVVNDLAQGEVWFGEGTGGVGILTMSGSSVFNASHWVQLGRDGGQGYAVLSGSVVFNAEYHMNNTNWTTIGGSFWGNHGGTGTMVLSDSSSLNIKAGGLRVGFDGMSGTSPSIGQLIVNAGSTVQADRSLFVGASGLNIGNGVMTVNGGTVSHKSFYDQGDQNAVIIGQWFGNGVWNQLGGSLLNNGRIILGDGNTAGKSAAIMNLDGGTVEATYLDTYGSGIGALNFNGGVLKAKIDNGNFIRNNITANVYSGGAIIDTNSYDLALNKSLLSPTGNGLASIPVSSGAGYTAPPVVQLSGGDGSGATAIAVINSSGQVTGITITNPGTGYTSAPTVTLVGGNPTTAATPGTPTLNAGNVSGGLTVRGGGSLRLKASNDYTGPTVVENGRLMMGFGASFSPLSNFEVKAQGILAGITGDYWGGATIGPLTIRTGGMVAPGDFTESDPLNQFGIIRTSGLTLENGAVLSINVSDTYNSQLSVQGNVAASVSGKLIVDITNKSSGPLPATTTVLDYNGSWSGSTTVLPAVDCIGTTAVSIAPPAFGAVVATFTDISTSNNWQGTGRNYSTTANWSTAGVQNGTTGQALFLGVNPGTINLDSGLSGNLTLSSLVFNSATAYTMSTDAGKSLILNSTSAANAQINDMAGSHAINVNVALNKSARITVAGASDVLTMGGVISGSGGITQFGPGTFSLTNPNNTYSGPTVMKYTNTTVAALPDNDSAGTLLVTKLANGGLPSSIGTSSSSPDNLVLAGTFKYTGLTDVTSDRGFTIGSYLYFDTGAQNVTMSGPVKGARSGGFYKYGSGTLTLSNTGENIAYDDFRVTEGTLVFDGSASTTWKLETGGQYFGAWRGAYLCVGDQNSASNVTMEIHNGSFDINGAVQVAFRGQNNIQATLNMTGGKIDCIYFDLGNCWDTCSAVANLSGNAYVYAHDNTYIGDAAGSTNTLNLSNNAVLETGKYVIMGYNVGTTATTTLDGNSQLIVQSGLKVSIIDPVTHLETADPSDYDGLNVGYHGVATLTVKGNAKVTTAPYMPTTMGLDGSSQGFLNIQGNANLMIGSLRVGERENAVGVVRQSGGSIGSMNSNTASGEYGSAVVNNETTVLSSWTIGGNIKNDKTAWSTTSYGYYGLSGGTMSPGPNNYLVVGYTGAGIFDQTGGTLNVDFRFRVGELAGSTGVANIGGTGIVNQRQVWTNTVGNSGYGVMNLSGGGQFNSNYRINLAANAGSTGILNLGAVGTGGGTLSVDWLQKGAGTAAVNFHGGTLVAHATPTTTNWIGLDSTVYGEGAILDSNGLSVTISSKLLAPTGKGVNTITLSDGGAGYVAPPAVKISGGLGSGATANAMVDTATGKVTGFVITNPGQGYGPSDTLTVQFVGGGCTTAATATITSANLIANVSTGGLMKKGSGTLTLTGDNTYGGDTLVNTGTLTLTKALNTPNASVKVATSATLNATSINADSLIIGGGPFAFTPHAAAVPEPSTLVLLVLAGLGALVAAWRRK